MGCLWGWCDRSAGAQLLLPGAACLCQVLLSSPRTLLLYTVALRVCLVWMLRWWRCHECAPSPFDLYSTPIEVVHVQLRAMAPGGGGGHACVQHACLYMHWHASQAAAACIMI